MIVKRGVVKLNSQITPIDRLAFELSKLPGIGEKTAGRMAFHIAKAPAQMARDLAHSLLAMADSVGFCSQCQNISPTDPCYVCNHPSRDHRLLCVVEEPADMAAIENTNSFRGMYYILHGALSPIDGIGPDDIRLSGLFNRLQKKPVGEVIVATNPTLEGEATALYILKLIKPLSIKLSRIASGVPLGGDLEYVDRATLSRAIEARREML